MAVVATGFFDGVHIGHRHVIDTLVSSARSRGEESIVVTFWPHPRAVLQMGARDLRLLTSLPTKVQFLKGLGVDRVEVLPFNPQFAAMTARDYLENILLKRFGATAIVVGYDNRIGSDCLCGRELFALAQSIGLETIQTEAVGLVSSSQIRLALSEGKIERANAMLGYAYTIHGAVIGGKQLGRTIGFPTANIRLYNPLKLIPMTGVYVSDIIVNGTSYRSLTNIANTIETHILDFDQDIYGLDVNIHLLKRLRDEKTFNSLEELKAQLSLDKSAVESMEL